MFFHFDAEAFQFPRIFYHFDAETFQLNFLRSRHFNLRGFKMLESIIDRCLDCSPDSRHERVEGGLLRLGLSGAELLLVPEAELSLIMQPTSRGLSVVEVREPSTRDAQPVISAHEAREYGVPVVLSSSGSNVKRQN